MNTDTNNANADVNEDHVEMDSTQRLLVIIVIIGLTALVGFFVYDTGYANGANDSAKEYYAQERSKSEAERKQRVKLSVPLTVDEFETTKYGVLLRGTTEDGHVSEFFVSSIFYASGYDGSDHLGRLVVINLDSYGRVASIQPYRHKANDKAPPTTNMQVLEGGG